jgi:hypothetical protein
MLFSTKYTYVYIYIRTCTICKYVCTYMYNLQVCMYVHVQFESMYVCMYICSCTILQLCMYVHVQFASMYVCTCTICKYVCMYVCMYMYNLQVHMYIHHCCNPMRSRGFDVLYWKQRSIEHILAQQMQCKELHAVSTRVRHEPNLIVLFCHEMGDKFVALVGSGRQVYVIFY